MRDLAACPSRGVRTASLVLLAWLDRRCTLGVIDCVNGRSGPGVAASGADTMVLSAGTELRGRRVTTGKLVLLTVCDVGVLVLGVVSARGVLLVWFALGGLAVRGGWLCVGCICACLAASNSRSMGAGAVAVVAVAGSTPIIGVAA